MPRLTPAARAALLPLVLGAAAFTAACSDRGAERVTGGPALPPSAPAPAPTPAPDAGPDTTSAETLRLAADQLYAAADSGADVAPGVRAVLDRLLPVLGADRRGEVAARLAAGRPVAFDFQAGLVARAFAERGRTSLASFAAAAARAGATTQDGAPLTAAALTDLVRPVAGQGTHAAEDVVPGLVLALGQARARRAGVAAPDPVWGDGQLDALQVLLLMYALQFSGLDSAAAPAAGTPRAAPAPAAGSREWIGARIADVQRDSLRLHRGWVAGRIGRGAHMPVARAAAPRTSTCASVLLNSYRLAVTASRTQLGRNDVGLPVTSEVRAALAVDFAPDAFAQSVLAEAGCALPADGAAPRRSVTWSTAGEIRQHGGLSVQDAETDASGRALATFETFRELVPAGLRTLAQDAAGTVDVRVSGLVPGWEALDRSAALGVQNPTDAGVALRVRHHAWPSAVQVEYSIGLASTLMVPSVNHDLAVTGTLTLPRREHDGVVEYYAEGPFAYARSAIAGSVGGCAWTSTGTRNGTVGFALTAYDDPTTLERTFAGTPFPTVDGGGAVEFFDVVCPNLTLPNLVGGFQTMLTSVYTPVDPGPFHARSGRPLVGWQTVEPGVLRKTVERTVAPLGGAGPVTERSTYTLRLVP